LTFSNGNSPRIKGEWKGYTGGFKFLLCFTLLYINKFKI